MDPVEEIAGDEIRPLLRKEYDLLVKAGAFDGERLELLRGRLVLMGPQYARHSSTVSRLQDFLIPRLLKRAQVRTQSPLSLTDDSEPEPDVAIVPLGDYDDEHPHTALWVIEVSDSSLRKYRELKPGIYAQAGVPDYWIVNVVDRHIEVYRNPIRIDPADREHIGKPAKRAHKKVVGQVTREDYYDDVRRYEEGETVVPLLLADLAIDVTGILPRKS